MEHKILQWHPAPSPDCKEGAHLDQAALQIELSDDAEALQFLREYNLTEKPLQIDTLVIRQDPGQTVQKSIGHIFRRYNVVEYKNPGDYISVNDFYKVLSYTCIYQANTEKVLEILPEELTITFIANRYPRKMIKHLKVRYGATVERYDSGIYYISGMMFPTQIVIIKQLEKQEYVWLSRLRSDLKAQKDIEPLAQAYKGNEKRPLYEAVMDMIIRANSLVYEEAKYMCEALRELFADELAERETRGIATSVIELLNELGSIPAGLENRILSGKNPTILKQWLKLAARSESIDAFMKQM